MAREPSERNKEILRRWSQGESFASIALAMGLASRNTVVGVVHRSGAKPRTTTKQVTFGGWPKHWRWGNRKSELRKIDTSRPASHVVIEKEGRPRRSGREMTKTELRAMLAEAVRQTAKL